MKIPIREIRSFKNHPFRAKNDEDMAKLVDSIRENGQIVPVIVRPLKDCKGYEMISGHRRKDAMKLLGHTTVEAEVRDDGLEQHDNCVCFCGIACTCRK